MKLFGLRLLIFTVTAFLFYCAMVFLWGTFAPYYLKKNLEFRIPGFMNARIKDIPNHKNVDILFIGSSHAYRGFDPRIFKAAGYHSFNLGSSSQTPIQSLALAKRYVPMLRPKLVVLEVYPEVFGLDGLESGLDILENDGANTESTKMTFKINHIKCYNALIFFTCAQLTGLNNESVEPERNDYEEYITGGYVHRRDSSFIPSAIIEKKWHFLPTQLSAFGDMIRYFKDEKISYVLVRAPISQSLYKAVNNNRFANELLSQYGELYDFNNLLSLNDSLYFFDVDHLNQRGVEKFNTLLIDTLVRAKLLTK